MSKGEFVADLSHDQIHSILLTAVADVPTDAVAVADVVVAIAATAEDAPATDEDAVPTADIAMD